VTAGEAAVVLAAASTTGVAVASMIGPPSEAGRSKRRISTMMRRSSPVTSMAWAGFPSSRSAISRMAVVSPLMALATSLSATIWIFSTSDAAARSGDYVDLALSEPRVSPEVSYSREIGISE
jgi:hypothetical protein